MEQTSNKRRRVTADILIEDRDSDCEIIGVSTTSKLPKERRPQSTTNVNASLKSPISPPLPQRPHAERHEAYFDRGKKKEAASRSPSPPHRPTSTLSRSIPSPIQLSTVNGLTDSANIDTVSLGDILGDPLIRECWLFNYLIDVDFIMYLLFSFICPVAIPLRVG